MGNYSNFARSPFDKYSTPWDGAPDAGAMAAADSRVAEVAAGDGTLVGHLTRLGHRVVYAGDLYPKAEDIAERDALTLTVADLIDADLIVTNLPFTHGLFEPLARHLITLRPLWTPQRLAWTATKQAHLLLRHCRMIIACPRVQWIENSEFTSGKEDWCWLLFEAAHESGPVFIPNSGRRGAA